MDTVEQRLAYYASRFPPDLPPQAYEEVWTRFLTALDPLVAAGRLGALLFQFPPWFTIRRAGPAGHRQRAATATGTGEDCPAG